MTWGRGQFSWPEFLREVLVMPSGCIEWRGRTDRKGYGMFRMTRAHIWAYRNMVGPIPEGLVLDHYICDNPPCVNWRHVRPVTSKENTLRGTSFAAANARKTECPKCHRPYDHTNSRGQRVCTSCRNARYRAVYRRKKKEERNRR